MLTIVWDVDDVLNELMRTWFVVEWLPSHPDCLLHFEDLAENPPHSVLGASRSEYLDSLDRFRLSPQARDMAPCSEFLGWFQEHGARFRHLALTARPWEMVPPLAEWVFRHFGPWIRTFAYVPSRSGEGVPRYDLSKGEYLTWLGKADILVDDNPEHLRAAASQGICGVLVPQPWNDSRYTASQVLADLSRIAGELEMVKLEKTKTP